MVLSTLPPELVREIICEVLASAESAPDNLSNDHFLDGSDFIGKNSKRGWDDIQSLTLSSCNYRNLTLAIWFRRLFLKSTKDVKDIDQYFPALKSVWCRHLHCVQHKDNENSEWDLSGFKLLSSMCVDWLYLGPMKAKGPGFQMVSPFINLESQVKELDIRGLRFPSPMTLKALTLAFIDVVILKLDCLRIWCSLCFTDSQVEFPSPAPNGFSYEGGIGLPPHYSFCLQSLSHLEEISIRLPDFGHGLPSPSLSEKVNDNLWMGECYQCMRVLYEDENFRADWVAQKRGLIPYKKLPHTKPAQLKKVSWSFWPFQGSLSNDGTGYSFHEIREFYWFENDEEAEEEFIDGGNEDEA